MDLCALLPRSTDAVVLRELAHRDAAAYAAGTADVDVRRFAHLPEPEYTVQRVNELVDTTIREGLDTGTLAVLAIAERSTDELLGSLVVFDITPESAEVGFWLDPAGRGRGVAGQALRLAADLARDGGLARLRARTVVENRASQRVLESAGFRPDGEPAPDTTPSGETALVQEYAVALSGVPAERAGREHAAHHRPHRQHR